MRAGTVALVVQAVVLCAVAVLGALTLWNVVQRLVTAMHG